MPLSLELESSFRQLLENLYFQSIADALTVGVFLSQTNGEAIYANAAALQMCGCTFERVLGWGWTNALHPDDRERVIQYWKQSAIAGVAAASVHRFGHEDGSICWVRARSYPIRLKGEVIGHVGTIEDLTAEYEARGAPQATEERFRRLVEHAADGFFLHDLQGNFIDVNKRACESLGYSREQLLSMSVQDIEMEYSSDWMDLWSDMMPGVPIAMEGVHRRKDGTQFPVELRVERFYSEGTPLVLAIVRDVTARKRREQALEMKINNQREDLMATLAHDLKVPLLGADRTLDALLHGHVGSLSADQQNVLKALKRSNEGLLQMIHNLLSVYRYDFPEVSAKVEPINLEAFLSRCIEEVSAISRPKGVHISTDLRTAGDILGDPDSLRHVFVNLLDNAIKFTEPGGNIEVRARSSGSSTTIEVEDNGPGISDEDQSRLFERFWQGEPGKRYVASTGLGLYLCRQIVEAHGGYITCTSMPEEGSTFTVVLKCRGKEA
jgi:PAS domain S-box-containing protein